MTGAYPRMESCREWIEEPKFDRCNERAVAILWGKLLPAEALGPRCEQHTHDHLGRSISEAVREGCAVYDLRPVNALHARGVQGT